MNLIKVNGYTINPDKVAMLDRQQLTPKQTGILLRFVGGGVKWIADPEAKEVEALFAKYDGVQESELPY